MARTPDLAGNGFNTAYNLGTFKNTTRTFTETVGKSDSNDYFRLKVSTNSAMIISLTKLSADVDMEIYYNGRSNPAEFTRSGRDNEVAVEPQAPSGTYYIRVLPGTNRSAEYTLTVHSVALPRNRQSSARARKARIAQFQPMTSGGRSRLQSSPQNAGRTLWT